MTDPWEMRVIVRPLLYVFMLSVVTSSVYHVLTTNVFSFEMAQAQAKHSADLFDLASKILWLCLFGATHIVLKAPDHKCEAINDILYLPSIFVGRGGLAIATHRACTAIAGPNFTRVSKSEFLNRFWYALWIIVLMGASQKVYMECTSTARAFSLITEDMTREVYQEEADQQLRRNLWYEQVSAAPRLSNTHSLTPNIAQHCRIAVRALQPVERHQIGTEDDCAICLRPLIEIHDGDSEHRPDSVVRISGCGHTFCRHE